LTNKPKPASFKSFFALLFLSLFLGISSVWCKVPNRPVPPSQIKAERQDFQAARITWKGQKDLRYFLYASRDQKPLDFHKENDGKPLTDHFVIWDAPREGERRFVFYVTAVDNEGQESVPSKHVKVDLGPLP
jgi:hypothetical protein